MMLFESFSTKGLVQIPKNESSARLIEF